MISIDPTFIYKFINKYEKDILACGADYNPTNDTSIQGNERLFLEKLKTDRENIIKMNKRRMIDFVKKDMNNDPIYAIYWDAYYQHHLNKIPKPDCRNQKNKSKYISTLCSKYSKYSNIPDNIKDSVEKIENFISNINIEFDLKTVNNKIEVMFDYNLFCNYTHDDNNLDENEDSDNKISLACQFVIDSEITCCPYCNRTFIETYDKNKKRTAELDHYFPKSLYPFFAISPWNLVPSCPSCNRIKHNPDTLKKPHLYPYHFIDPQVLVFIPCPKDRKKAKDPSFDYSKIKDFDILVKCPPNKYARKLAKKSKKIFHLEELYQNHKKTVSVIYELLRLKGDIFLEDIAQHFITDKKMKNKIQTKKQEFIKIREEMISPYGKEGMLGKLSQDIRDFFMNRK